MPEPEAVQLVQAAVAALAAGHSGQAAKLLERALLADPSHPMVLTKLAELAICRKDFATALRLTNIALQIEPNFAPAWHVQSSALWLVGCQADAVVAARRAVDIQPPNPEFRLRLAQFAAWMASGIEARAVLQPLLETTQAIPGYYAAAVAMLGEIAIADGRFNEALPCLDHALQIQPTLETARMLRGMTLLRLGRYAEGWDDYAAREHIRQLYPDVTAPLADQPWLGQDLTGKTLLVTDDQGHGDAIQFFRYLPMLRSRGAASITWRTFPALTRLLAGSTPYATVVAAVPAGARFDFESNSTNLARIFGTTLATIPAPTVYLRPSAQVVAKVKDPIGRRPKVGLVWSGDPTHTRDHLRSIPAALFLTLADLPGVTFHSLQHEVRPADLPALNGHRAVGREIENATDFADTAALIARLDLVVAVDTAVAHLSAAMGKQVWLLLHVVPDWRWLADRMDSPWYPSIRLFRVTRSESTIGWGPVISRVSVALQAFAGRGAIARRRATLTPASA